MDLNYLFRRQQISLFRSDNATCDRSRDAHRAFADAYSQKIASKKNPASAVG